ncbi:homeobox-leucine zipper protein HDG12 [Artemisia annua]|uniref:Homeobox-leucine zipper protein HDG12 n=1 Tax=Artemisia annua TaxID=35608 RepID=A0A2U1QKP1_ARTAN|nr:homeobox-leucine zipper protein HDG12 [Artemisia annua]
MVRCLFRDISPIERSNSTLLWSVTGPEDLKVHASLYEQPFANFEVAGAVVAFGVKHSPEFVLQTLGDVSKHHEWDVLGGSKKLCMLTQYSTGADPRNNISASLIEGSSGEILIKEVDVNRSGSLVVWSSVSKKDFDLISNGQPISEDSVLISGFSISADGHTTGGSSITLVLRMLVEGDQPLQEKRQRAIDLITDAVNQTVKRVKEALDKQRPPSIMI